MKKILITLIALLFLGCQEDITGLDDVLVNPLDETQVTYETPAFVFYPDQFDVGLGTSFQAEIFAMGVENLRGVSVIIQYDQNKLNLLNVNSGTLSPGSNPMFFVDTDTQGLAEIVAVYLSSDSASVSGNIKIAEMVFTAKSIGSSTLDFTSDCKMLDPDDNLIEIKGFAQGVVNAQ